MSDEDRWLVFEARLTDGSTVQISRAGGVTRSNFAASVRAFERDARQGAFIPVDGGHEAGYPHVNAAHIVHLSVIETQRDDRLG